MQNTEKQREDSGKVQIPLLVVLALAAGGAGVWSELKAAPVTRNAGSQIDVGAGSDTNPISGSISLNGDGTASVGVFEAKQKIFQLPGIGTVIENLSLLLASDPAH